jgi:hypothetical protein
VVLPVEICEVKDLGTVKSEWCKESMLRAPALIDITNLTTIEEKLIRDHYALPLKKTSENDHNKNRELVLNALQ